MMIGKLAKESGVGIETIRFYERRGLLLPVKRKPSGYREYDEESLIRIEFIKKAKDLGFSLDEVGELLAMKVQNKSHCKKVYSKATEKLENVRAKIKDLERIASVLESLIGSCEQMSKTGNCPILESLEGRGPS